MLKTIPDNKSTKPKLGGFLSIFKWLGAFFKWLASVLARDSNEKQIRKLQPIVDRINALEPDFKKLTDAELRAKTNQF